MADWDMQMVRIIVGDGLPVEIARAKRHPADRAQILEPVGRHFGLIGRHHLVNRGQPILQADEDETAPDFHRHRDQPELVGLKVRIFVAVHDPDQPPVASVAPGVIGTG